jgi:hypothetical protein
LDIDHLDHYNLPEFHELFWCGICDIFVRRWFTRVWAVEEVGRAKRVEVHCGFSFADWDDLAFLAERLQAYGLSCIPYKYHGIGGGEP